MEKNKKTMRELLSGAQNYIPTAVKDSWVADTATKVFRRMEIKGTDGNPVPPLYSIDAGREERFLMTALVSRYFCLGYEPDPNDANLMSEECYDFWAAENPVGQLKRIHGDSGLKALASDILDDFQSLRLRLYAAVNGAKVVLNDPVARQNEYMAAQMMQGLPELLKLAQEQQGAGGSGNA